MKEIKQNKTQNTNSITWKEQHLWYRCLRNKAALTKFAKWNHKQLAIHMQPCGALEYGITSLLKTVSKTFTKTKTLEQQQDDDLGGKSS